LQSATESSRIPKSVMKTIVGGGGPEDGWARTAVADKNTKQKIVVEATYLGALSGVSEWPSCNCLAYS
jgi:hypothetical protein